LQAGGLCSTGRIRGVKEGLVVGGLESGSRRCAAAPADPVETAYAGEAPAGAGGAHLPQLDDPVPPVEGSLKTDGAAQRWPAGRGS
jgi:hypothetical protein